MRTPVSGLVLIILTALFANLGQVHAQDEAEATIEEILVTGSHIRREEFSGTSPVQVISTVEIEAAGATQIQDVLKTITANSGSDLNNEVGFRSGTTQFSLRGLGLSSTLTLINGRRGGVSALSDDNGADFLDINQFPLAMVERVEVLTDGSSATYGSEAVAGVVNVITRKGFEGFEISADYRNAVNESYTLNLAAGSSFEQGTFNIYATYYDQTEALRSDFDFYKERVLGNGDPARSRLLSSTGSPGNYLRAILNADGNPETLAGAARVPDPDCLAAGGVFRVDDAGVVDTARCRFDFSDQLPTLLDQTRAQVFAEADYELTDNLTFYTEASFSRNIFTGPQGGRFFGNGLVEDSGRPFIPGDHPFNFFIEDPADATNIVYIGPDAWDPAIHTGVDLSCECRPFGKEFSGDLARGDFRYEWLNTRFVGGLEAELFSNWFIDTSYMFASSNFNWNGPNNFASDRFNDLLLSGEFNPFGTRLTNPDLISPKDGVSTSLNEEETLQRFDAQTNFTQRTVQQAVEFVITGDVFDVPAGPVGFAVGGQYRKLDLEIIPDPLEGASEGPSPGRQFVTDASQDVVAWFAEAIIPVASNTEIQLAARHEDFGGNIGSSFDPKVSLKFSPAESMTLRGSYGTSFRAPTLAQDGETRTESIIDDSAVAGGGTATCGPGGNTNAVIVVNSGGGLTGLDPQSSDNFNIGAIFQPTDSLNFSVDYWQYDYTDLIAPSESAQAIVDNDCASDGIPNDPRITRGGGGQISRIDTSFTNIGSVLAEGFDFAAQYNFAAGEFGLLTVDFAASLVQKFEVSDGSGKVDLAGSRNFSNGFGPQPELRANLSLFWSMNQHNASAIVRYIDGYDNDQSNNAPIDSYTTIDLRYGISFDNLIGTGQTSFAIGANNLFDEDPPALRRYDASGILIQGINAIDRPSYDEKVHPANGRTVYVQFKQSF